MGGCRDSQKLPGPVRAIGNFVSNLMYPITLGSASIQGKLHGTGNDITRGVADRDARLATLADLRRRIACDRGDISVLLNLLRTLALVPGGVSSSRRSACPPELPVRS
jgi:hypothetical protein